MQENCPTQIVFHPSEAEHMWHGCGLVERWNKMTNEVLLIKGKFGSG